MSNPNTPSTAPDDKKNTPSPAYVGRPLDGSQYVDVIEEQEYADRPPTREEQRPRHGSRGASQEAQPEPGQPGTN